MNRTTSLTPSTPPAQPGPWPDDELRSVSVIIVNFRTPDLTIEAIESALGQPEANEIIVVDNASNDASVERLSTRYADEGRVRLISLSENVGFGRGNNADRKSVV